ncbi:glycosyltransferase family 2 protein [Curtobacterium sp. MWU13-2055]|uniref:glycosyltransferase family 2 protein n=1 Tax=Curtobacterium sp. MWU13-2055 TaxID=2931928 RepID=UPI00200DA664|nr:glycosyltransferase family 2 protein [Curtobacterium sp. MWU13-2055]
MFDQVGDTLSVVVAAKNSVRWIGELLESISAQHLSFIEVIVVDNGSTDGTPEIVVAAAEVDPTIRLIRSPATSAAAARNEGVRAANGKYLVFADSDDLVPDGAYRAMLDALTASGSDMVIGNHFKFSSSRTWSPTERWHDFDRAMSGVSPRDFPALLAVRACWNRMFRRSFWDSAELHFPEISSVEDIQPMTRAFASATAIDVVPSCVYLYRDRGDSSSLSIQSDAMVTVRYLEQECICAALVRDDAALRLKHAEVVLDADGWAHLQRFLSGSPEQAGFAVVARATRILLEAIPLDGMANVGPLRRALWLLILGGNWTAAAAFVRGTTAGSETERIRAWLEAVALIRAADVTAASSLVAEGVLVVLVNGADAVDPEQLAQHLPALRGLELEASGSDLLVAMAEAVRVQDFRAVSAVSALRNVVPLVVDRVDATPDGLVLGGPMRSGSLPPETSIVLESAGKDAAVASVEGAAGRWRAIIKSETCAPGRYGVVVSANGIERRFPVVTARMPLPPLAEELPMQPLADRQNGWRFLIDRRPDRKKSIGRLLRRVVRGHQ